jgi:hypothetical protein
LLARVGRRALLGEALLVLDSDLAAYATIVL